MGRWVARLVGVTVAAYAANRLAVIVRQMIAGQVAAEDLLAEWGRSLAADPLSVSTARPDLIAAAVAAVVVALVFLYRATQRPDTRPGAEHGSAAWASPRDYAAVGPRRSEGQLRLTEHHGLSLNTHRTQRNLNVLLIGGSGAGKSRSYVMPNLAAIRSSVAVCDPKGELEQAAKPHLLARGYTVRRFDLIDLSESAGFNPMAYFDAQSPEVSVQELAHAIIANTSGSSGGKDQFWERAEQALLTALLAYVWGMAADAGREPTLVEVADLQQRMMAYEGDKADENAGIDDEMESLARILAEEGEAGEEPRPQPVTDCLAFATRQYRTFQQGAGETKKSIIISLGVRLAPLDITDVRRILSHDTIDLHRAGFERTALFLRMPDTHGAFTFLAAMFWSTLFRESVSQADQRGGPLPAGLHCFLDEFANIGQIPNFEKVIATIRSRGISASVIVQAYSQGKALWKEQWPTIVGNCDTLLFLGSTDQDTLKWVSERLGDQTIYHTERTYNRGSSGGWSHAQRAARRALQTPDELQRLDPGKALLLIRQLRPILDGKIPPLHRRPHLLVEAAKKGLRQGRRFVHDFLPSARSGRRWVTRQ